jgi:exonuclease III
MQINIRGINKVSKFDKFKLMLSQLQNKLDIIVIGETKLKPRFPINLYNLPGYNRLAACRSCAEKGAGGGGLLVFIRKEFKIINQQSVSIGGASKFSFQKIHIQLKNDHKTFSMTAYYRPPESNNAEEFMKDLETVLNESSGMSCIVGDININSIDDSKLASSYLGLLTSYDFNIMNNLPTRNVSGKTIDHFVCNFSHEATISNSTITMRDDFSDHCMIVTTLDAISPPKTAKFKSILKVNHPKLKQIFSQRITAPDLLSCCDPNLIANNLTKIIQIAIHDSTTESKINVKNERVFEWYNERVRNAMSRKEKLATKVRRNRRNRAAKIDLRNASIHLRAVMREERKKSDEAKFNCRDQKQLWKNINETLGREKSKHINALRFGDAIIDDERIMAEKMNDHFIETIEEAIKTIPARDKPSEQTSSMHSLYLSPPDITEVTQVILSLKKSSCGVDSISPMIIKSLGHIVAPYITFLIEKILETGTYPDCLKIALVTPINKSGDIANPCDYRPVSVLPTINKVIEKIIYNRLVNYFEKNDIIFQRQFGFRRKSGTEGAAIELVHHVQREIDNKKKVSLVFMDLTKAFDIVDHALLREALWNVGIRGPPLKILTSYLDRRMQTVKIGNERSETRRVTSGVVQGSVLGPLLFNVFINEIAKLNLSGELFLYADDVVLVNSHPLKKPISHIVQQDMSEILSFIRNKKLLLNPKKTRLMIAHSPHSKIALEDSVTLNNGAVVERVTEVMHLGLLLDQHLKWDAHCAHLRGKLSSAAGMLWKLRHRLPLKIKKSIYHTLFETHLSYMSPVWSNASDTIIKPLQVIQNRALRNVFDLDRLTNRVRMYLDLVENCLPIRAIGFLNTSSYIYGALHNLIHTNLRFDRVSSQRSQRRPQAILKEELSKSNFGRKSITSFGVKLFNFIPNDIKALRHMHAFKWALRCHLRHEKFLEHCFTNDYLRKFG